MMADDNIRGFPRWSPDGKYVAYWHQPPSAGRYSFYVWSTASRTEVPVSESVFYGAPFDWTPDGRFILTAEFSLEALHQEIWLRPVVSDGQQSPPPRKIASHPSYDLYQPHPSPDGKWLVLIGFRDRENGPECRLLVKSWAGGALIPLLDAGHFDDKPRWSPDGKTIYFLSDRRGFFNVWGVRFDPNRGRTIGQPFQITHMETPELTVPGGSIATVEISISRDKLAMDLSQRSGNIWVLDDVDK